MDSVDDFVNVAVRVRPCTKNENKPYDAMNLIKNNPPVLLVVERGQSYSFDNIFMEDSTQEQVYRQMVEPLIDKVISGYNCSVFAYGQTGTGKTYTIGSDSNKDSGIIIRTFETIFNKSNENTQIEVYISFYEIYNEKVYDLLSKNKASLRVKGFSISNLNKLKVSNVHDANDMILLAGKNRHTGDTRQNSNSSRSHAVFTIYCRVINKNNEVEAKINLVDLAGSESVKKTGTEGSQFHEGVNINKGLLSIGQVINALSLNHSHIPYRQSMITTILQDSLNRKNYATLIACVSPNSDDIHDSIQTLEFAQRAKRLKNKPELNSIVMRYTKENPYLLEVMNSVKKTKVVNSRYITPMKRSCVFQTSTALKRPKVLSSTLSKNLEQASISMNLSSISSIHDAPNLSPIVKKCVDAIESTVMEKLKDLVKETPTVRKSSRFSWNKLQSTISQLVRDEVKLIESEKLAHSSPIQKECSDDLPLLCPLKDVSIQELLINSDGLANISDVIVDKLCKSSEILERKRDSQKSEKLTFKLPDVPKRKRQAKGNSPKRRSTRLSLKRLNSPKGIESPPTPIVRSSCRPPKSSPIGGLRRSVRLSVRNKTPPKPAPRKLLSDVPTPTPRKIDSHDVYVLKILNSGDVKEIKKLHTIGQKTAEKIVLCRQIRGNYKQISDLTNVLSHGKTYTRFLESNFLSDDCK